MADNPALQSLYPFLHGARQDAARLDEALLESVRQKVRDSLAVKEAFFEASAAQVVEAARAIAQVYENGGKLFAIGNGGSSCDAAHIAVEFLHPVTAGRPALSAVNLVADTAMMTAVGNDVGFAHIFVRQLIAQARRGDALIGISTSGNSDNLLTAFAKAKEMGLVTIGLVGGEGGKMKQSRDVDYCLVVPSDSIHRVQECHVAIYHILWDLVHTLLADKRGGLRYGTGSGSDRVDS
ncbi:MAG: SIS domain-containing protein [Acidobacteriota bacterium]|nr:SIS domain-containing protein [Acidobacteriota bacterium]